jgi:hypothetical protein
MENKMASLKEQMKKDAEKKSGVQKPKKAAPKKKISFPKDLELYSVAATLYGEAGELDNKGITRVAETIRNRYNYYNKNKAKNVEKITYRDIVAAKNQYIAFNAYKNKSLEDFQKFENSLSAKERIKWDRCIDIARKVVNGNLKTNYAIGALGFNQASIERNKRAFNTTNVFRDDSFYVDKPNKPSPHVFFGDFYLSPLKDKNGKLLAKGGNPKCDTSHLIAQNKTLKSRTD